MWIVTAFLLVSFACVSSAVVLMYKSKNGWGWLLFVAFLFGAGAEECYKVTVRASSDNNLKIETSVLK